MGKTIHLGPATLLPASAEQNTEAAPRSQFEAGKQGLVLHGADLYRLNCRGCHGEFGLGAPPEINSVIEPSRATSAPFILDRMRKRGMETSRAQATEMANQAKESLLKRLHVGGVDMPPFPQLSDPEVRAIFGYLRQLAEIPGAERQQVSLEEPSVRVGEHIVKSTCHICHNAVGVNPGPNELMQGTIPPLSTLTTRVSLPEFERKVRHGAPILMGTPLVPYRGRMPVFDYLSEREVADAYLYLKQYPPATWTDTANPPNQTQSASAIMSVASIQEPPNGPPHGDATNGKILTLPVIAAVLVALLIAGGGIFTVYDVKKSRGKGWQILGMRGDSLTVQSTPGGPMLVLSSERSSGTAKRRPDDHKQAAWHSRFHRSEYDLFERSWLSRKEDEDGAA